MTLKIGRVTLRDPGPIRPSRPRPLEDNVGILGDSHPGDGPRGQPRYRLEGQQIGSSAQASIDPLVQKEGGRLGDLYVYHDGNPALIPEGYYAMGTPSYTMPGGAPGQRPWDVELVKNPLPFICRQAEDDHVRGTKTSDRTADEASKVVYAPTAIEQIVLHAGSDLVLDLRMNEVAGSGAEQVENGDFSTWTTTPGVPDTWSEHGAGAGVTVSKETTIFRSGPNAARVRCDWAGGASLGAVHGFSKTYTLTAGKSYRYEAWVYLVDALQSSEVVVAKLRNSTDAIDLIPGVSFVPSVGVWTLVTGTFRARTGRTYTTQFGLFRTAGTDGATDVIFDDISIKEVQATDTSGLGHHGVLGRDDNVAGPTIGVTGKLGTAYSFDDLDDVVLVSDFDYGVMRQGNEDGQFTLECLYKVNGTPAGNERIVLGREGFHGGILQYVANGGRDLRFKIVDDQAASHQTGTAILPDTTNYFLLHAVYDKRSMLLAVNGVDAATGTFPSDRLFRAYSTNLHVGGAFSGGFTSDASLQAARVIKRALTAQERLARYNAIKDGVRPANDTRPSQESLNLPAGAWKCIARVQAVSTTTVRLRWRILDLAGTVLATGSQVSPSVAGAWTDVDLGSLTVPDANDGANLVQVLVQDPTNTNPVWLDRLFIVPQ